MFKFCVALLFWILGPFALWAGAPLRFATSAEYPPMEYYSNGQITGFDIELAQMVARELGRTATFEDMQFVSILPALNTGLVDAAIASIAITEARAQHFDFSDVYFVPSLALMYNDEEAPTLDSADVKVACQMGAIAEIWLRENFPDIKITLFDSNNQAAEALKSGQVGGVLIDDVSCAAFAQMTDTLKCAQMAAGSDANGYAIALKKTDDKTLLTAINEALRTLKDGGQIEQLRQKWLSTDATL